MRNLKEGVISISRYCISICLQGIRKTMKSLRIAHVPARMQNKHLLNTNLEHCCSASLLVVL
jgi:hypothetical protein